VRSLSANPLVWVVTIVQPLNLPASFFAMAVESVPNAKLTARIPIFLSFAFWHA